MAWIRLCAALALTGLTALAAAPARGQAPPAGLHDRPILVVDSGRHSAPIHAADIDAVGRFAVTASSDKTVRVWSLADGRLERTIRLPANPGNLGMAFAVAIDPKGELIAAGGWTSWSETKPDDGIYLYSRATGALAHRIQGLPQFTTHLTFSQDGRYLAAVLLRSHGLRVYDRERNWEEAARDTAYGGDSYGAAFAPDGRLATTSDDGQIRLYGADFAVPPRTQRAPGGARPFGIAFNHDGTRLAVGYDDSTRIDVLDGRSLEALFAAATVGIDNGDLSKVAWAADGTLLAAGVYDLGVYDFMRRRPVLAWSSGGRGERRILAFEARSTVMSLRPLSGGDLFIAAQDPFLGRMTAVGGAVWSRPSPNADYLGQARTFSVSTDGTVVDFDYAPFGTYPARFDIAGLALILAPPQDGRTIPPRQHGLAIEGWADTDRPLLGGEPLPLENFETSRSLAIHPKGDRFVLGTEWRIRAFDATGKPLWVTWAPGVVWAVNISGDGRLVVAAYADGTIRWYRMDDGREILALVPLADRANWVAWTPEGFYAASPGAHGILRWHVNQPDWQPARAFAVADIPGFYRPEAIRLVLQEMETPRAVGLAVLAEQRRKVQIATNSGVPPGARLHLLAVGVSRYSEQFGNHLRLEFAQKDAQDVMAALGSTQDGLYVQGSRQYLPDDDAVRASIRRGLASLREAMTSRDDLAVVHFSGHGAMVDGKLYLLPQNVDARDKVTISDTGLSMSDLRDELLKIAATGRVLVLLDACYSGGASIAGGAQVVASEVLAAALAAANINILTSSSDSQVSRESAAWQNGALTKAVLEALEGREADENKDGLLSATELASYVHRRVRNLTAGRQSPAMEIRFDGTLFAVK